MGVIHMVTMAFNFLYEYFTVFNFIPSTVYFVAGILVWIVSPKLSRALARRNDGDFDLRGIGEQQLYSAVFLGLGLYFTLSSFAATFSWIHFFAVNKSPDYGFHQEDQPSYYDMTETAMTLVAGIVLVVTCNTWARKLSRNQPGEQVATDS
jgi:hypothetical protein